MEDTLWPRAGKPKGDQVAVASTIATFNLTVSRLIIYLGRGLCIEWYIEVGYIYIDSYGICGKFDWKCIVIGIGKKILNT